MKKTLSGFFVSILLTVALVSCGYNSSSNQYAQGSIKLRAFVSNPVFPNGAGGGGPALEIVDASKDILSTSLVSLSGAVPDAGMMALSPKRDRTLIYSPSSNSLAIVSNAQASVASTVSLLGPTESMFVWTDNTTAFVAVPNAAVAGQPAGVVQRIDISTASTSATIPIPGARFLVPSPSGKQILVISDSANTVTLFDPSLIGSGNPLTTIPVAFDKPVWAVFSADGSTAYVMNCGPECGGTAAGVAVLDMTQNPPVVTATIPVAAATTGLLSGGTLYVAGTPSASGVDCQATLCGVLTLISGAGLSSVPITDGYHNHIVMGTNGQLFVGSRTCTNVTNPGPSTLRRGCLSVFSTIPTSSSIIPCGGSGNSPVFCSSQIGDVTAIEPIPNRNAVYVCAGGKLTIYDTTKDIPPPGPTQGPLEPQTTQVSITGQAIDVKVVDF